MNKRLTITLSLVLTLSVLSVSCYLLFNSSSNAMVKELDNNISHTMEMVDKGAKQDFQTQVSSNPYNYAKDNIYFEKIVEMGYLALPLIEDYIKKSPQNGLREYLLAIAVEKIAKVDLKANGNGWYSAKTFINEWDRHLKLVPSKTTTILNSNRSSADKVSELKKLGLPAVPFIIDYLDNNNADNTEILTSLEYFLKDSKIPFSGNDLSNFIDWSKSNKNQIDALRNYIKDR